MPTWLTLNGERVRAIDHPLHDLIRVAQAGARASGRMLLGDGDWDTILLIDGARPTVFSIRADSSRSLHQVVEHSLGNHGATAAVLVWPGWACVVEPNADGSAVDLADRPRPRDAVDRYEVLNISAVSGDGLAMAGSARVTRSVGQPPELGAFHFSESTGGGIIDAMRSGLAPL